MIADEPQITELMPDDLDEVAGGFYDGPPLGVLFA